MRTSTFLRAGAVLTASALAFSLGAGPVSAAETTAGTAAVATAEPVSGAGVPTSGLQFGSNVIKSSKYTRFFGNGSFSVEDRTVATVYINGRRKGTRPVLFSGPPAPPGDTAIAVDIPRGWGPGKVRLEVAGVRSNVFFARRNVKSTVKYPLDIRRVNSRVTFKAREIKIVKPSSGRYISIKRVKLQQRRNGTWKTIKTIKLNKRGTGSYRTSIKKKHSYRLYVPRTSTHLGFRTEPTKKI